jgi:hypothetical protein
MSPIRLTGSLAAGVFQGAKNPSARLLAIYAPSHSERTYEGLGSRVEEQMMHLARSGFAFRIESIYEDCGA